MRPTAETLNGALERGGWVIVATYTRATHYKPKHAGMFFEKDGSLHVKRGRTADKLSMGDQLLVGIRFAPQLKG